MTTINRLRFKAVKLLSRFLVFVIVFTGATGISALAAPMISVTAAGAVIMDCQTGEIYYQKQMDVPRHAASMTKVMSVYLVFEEIKAGRLSLSTPIKVSAYASSVSRNPDYSGMENLKEGSSYPVDTLLRLVMTASCNGSIIALAEHIGGTEANFVNMMNNKAKEWGVSAHYADCSGYEDEGNAVTPRAQATIARKIILEHPEILKYSSLKSTQFQGETYYSTNKLLIEDKLQGIDGLKTGTTTAAGYCFTGTASRNGRRIISVVMASTSSANRMDDSAKLLEYGFAVRSENEANWPKDTSLLSVDFSTVSGNLFPFAENTVKAVISNVGGGPVPCEAGFEADGKVYSSDLLMVLDGTETSFTVTPQAASGNVSVALELRFPDGHTEKRETLIPIGSPLTFSGTMGVASANLYPGMSLRIPCALKCDQNVVCSIPAGWYLDGQPIPGYQNPNFKCSPTASSGFTFSTKGLATGTHVLELRLNPQGLPGITKTSFSATLEILSELPDIKLPAA